MTDTLSHTAALLEAVLFTSGGSVTVRDLAHTLDCSEQDIAQAVSELERHLRGSGLAIVQTERAIALTTAPEVSDDLARISEQTASQEIGAAGLEVLALVLYRGPTSRATIDYVRGVNSSSSIRLLLSRGLLERVRGNGNEYVYRVSPALLAHLGVRSPEDLPEKQTISESIASFESSMQAESESSEESES